MATKIRTNQLKQRLLAGETVYGPFLRLATPAVVEIFGHAGFDFCIIDTEHGALSVETVENMVRAAQCAGITPIVRTSFNTPWMILRALDAGAQGVQVPGVGTGQEAAAVARGARFHPEGERGVCRTTRAAQYSHVPAVDYFPGANHETLVIIHVEGAAGVENLDAILAVPGIDLIFLGPYDLSQYLGLTGQVEHPRVIALLHELIERIRHARLCVGIYTDKPERVAYWREAGVQYIAHGLDTGILYQTASNLVAQIRGVKV